MAIKEFDRPEDPQRSHPPVAPADAAVPVRSGAELPLAVEEEEGAEPKRLPRRAGQGGKGGRGLPGAGGGNVRPFPGGKRRGAVQPVSDADYKKMMQRARAPIRRAAIASFALVVLLPTLLTGLYYAFIASDQYSVSAKFAVRGSDAGMGDLTGMLLGASGSAPNAGDSYIVQEFISSRDLIDRLEDRTQIVERYARSGVDFLSRADPADPREDFLDYWRSMVTAEFDSFSGIITMQVKAFTPQDARDIAALVIDESSSLVNRLSEQARQDTLALARREVAFAEDRLREARTAVSAFSDSVSTVDFQATASAQQETVSKLEGQLVNARAELEQLLSLVSNEAPSVRVLKTRIAALESQLASQKLLVGGVEGGAIGMTGQLEQYQGLRTEVEFAERAYISALSALDIARAESKKTHRYLATFVNPTLPTSAEYPLRLINTLLVLVVAAVAWAIGALVIAAIRDHAA